MKKKSFILFFCTFLGILFFKQENTFKEIESIKKEEKILLPEETKMIESSVEKTDKIGELMIPKTSFSVSIVQTDDNQFYLNHNIYKEYDALGTPFLDYRCSLESKKLLIYGHNSRIVKTDFQFLENYLNFSFYQKYPEIYLKTSDKTMLFQIVSIFITTDSTHMRLHFSDNEWENHLKWLKERSLYSIRTNLSVSDQILVLQTCYYEPLNSYLLLVAKQIESM